MLDKFRYTGSPHLRKADKTVSKPAKNKENKKGDALGTLYHKKTYFKEKGFFMAYENFVPVIGTIFNITRGNDCCSQVISLRTENGIVNFIINSQTQVIDNRQLRMGMRVAAFYDGSLPVPLIFPPRYQAQIVTVLDRNEQVMLSHFDRNLLADNRSLQLNIAGNTNIRTANGQNFNCNPANQTLLVYYTATTRSIPPQTTPSRLVVFC